MLLAVSWNNERIMLHTKIYSTFFNLCFFFFTSFISYSNYLLVHTLSISCNFFSYTHTLLPPSLSCLILNRPLLSVSQVIWLPCSCSHFHPFLFFSTKGLFEDLYFSESTEGILTIYNVIFPLKLMLFPLFKAQRF